MSASTAAVPSRRAEHLDLIRPAGPDGKGHRGRSDIPQHPAGGEAGRALPAGVLNQLIGALPALEQASGPDVRAAVELLMDTGRRPAEICKLGWDCLDQDADGKHALIYTDFKANKAGRRLPVTGKTAQVITGQQDQVRARYPGVQRAMPDLYPERTADLGWLSLCGKALRSSGRSSASRFEAIRQALHHTDEQAGSSRARGTPR
jgi:integrase